MIRPRRIRPMWMRPCRIRISMIRQRRIRPRRSRPSRIRLRRIIPDMKYKIILHDKFRMIFTNYQNPFTKPGF